MNDILIIFHTFNRNGNTVRYFLVKTFKCFLPDELGSYLFHRLVSYSVFIVERLTVRQIFKYLIDKNINKTRLREEAGISSNAMAKLGRNESVRVDVLVKICNHLGCTMDDIMEIIPDEVGDNHA